MSIFDQIALAPLRPLCWASGHDWQRVDDGPVKWRCSWCEAESTR